MSHLYQVMNQVSHFADLSTQLSVVPPWWPLSDIMHTSFLDPKLAKRSLDESTIFRALISKNFSDREEIYTDCSLIKNSETLVVAGMSIPNQNLKFRWKIPDYHSIISAVLLAILKAVNFIRDSKI